MVVCLAFFLNNPNSDNPTTRLIYQHRGRKEYISNKRCFFSRRRVNPLDDHRDVKCMCNVCVAQREWFGRPSTLGFRGPMRNVGRVLRREARGTSVANASFVFKEHAGRLVWRVYIFGPRLCRFYTLLFVCLSVRSILVDGSHVIPTRF